MKNGLDEQYIDLLKDILENGSKKNTRNGEVLSVFGRTIRYKFKDGKFPLLTTKKMYFKGIIAELLYFLRGNTSIKYLVDNGCNIWNGDLSKYHGVDVSKYKELAKLDSNLYEGGALYPHQWRNFGSNNYNRKRVTTPFKTSFIKESHNLDSNDENVGKEFSTLNYGNYIVLDSLKKGDRNEIHYKIQFINTNTIKNIRKDKLGANIVDPYMPIKKGVACVGKYKKYNHLNIEKLKNIWNGMISRCYNPSNDNYNYYGGRGVYVENRWLCFEYFLSDVDKIKNWENKVSNWDEYDLDKDIYGDGFKYSLETCCWLSKSDNVKKNRQKFIYKVSNGVDEHEFINHVDFINKFKINNQGNFASMLRGDRLNCEGWHLISKNKISDGVDQIQELINTLKTNPDSRRMLVTAWNPNQLDNLCLPACHYGFQVWTRELTLEERYNLWFVNNYETGMERYFDPNKLPDFDNNYYTPTPKREISLQWSQRSVDVGLGWPYNVASYALLLEIIGKMVNMVPGELSCSLGDCHIYSNHIDGIKEQLSRNPFPLPTLKHVKSDDFYKSLGEDLNLLTNLNINDFIIDNYQSHPPIRLPLSN
jgi:thymidylate synthase